MSVQKKNVSPAAKKLVPRTAPKVEVLPGAEALADAAAVPVAVTAAAAALPEVVAAKSDKKTGKPGKSKLVRDSFAMPAGEYAQIAVLKKRLGVLGTTAKKSELLRAGFLLLTALGDAELQAVMGRVERVKTGRPAK